MHQNEAKTDECPTVCRLVCMQALLPERFMPVSCIIDGAIAPQILANILYEVDIAKQHRAKQGGKAFEQPVVVKTARIT